MKVTTLMDLYHTLKGTGGEEMVLPDDILDGAGRCIRKMIELGG